MATQTDEAGPAQIADANFSALMQAINGCQAALTAKIDSLQAEMGLMRRDQDKIRGRVTEVERRLGEAEDVLHDHMGTPHTAGQAKIPGDQVRGRRKPKPTQ